MLGFHLMNVASWISSVSPPKTSTSTAEVSSMRLTLRCRIQLTAVCEQHADDQHAGGDVDARQLVGDEERDDRKQVDQKLHACA